MAAGSDLPLKMRWIQADSSFSPAAVSGWEQEICEMLQRKKRIGKKSNTQAQSGKEKKKKIGDLAPIFDRFVVFSPICATGDLGG